MDYYTTYTLAFTYTYDLNDGKGLQTATFKRDCQTLPYIDVIECSIANTSAVSEGDTIFMSVKLDNPLGMTIESVVVNGETYSVTGASTKNKIFVEIVYNGQFDGGDTYLKVDLVNAKIDNVSRSIEPKTELSDNIFINGKLEVLKVEFVNEDFEPICFAFPSDKVYVMITMENPTGYNIDAVNGETGKFVKLDDDHWYGEAELPGTWSTYQLWELSYSYNDFSKNISCSICAEVIFAMSSDEIKYISTADDLKNMDDGYYYELANDIDLAGLEWVGGDFVGVFDGKGYSIKNMSFVGTVTGESACLGLFSTGTGIIQNVTIEEATIIADLVSDSENPVMYSGGLVALSQKIVIDNCTIDEYSVFSIKNSTGSAYAGGFVGYVESSDGIVITNSHNNGSISASSTVYAKAGGLFASTVTYAHISISNSSNSGDISATNYAGGLVGYIDINTTFTIDDCHNQGSVIGETTAGGIVGFSGCGTIKNCTNLGTVSGGETAGGIVGVASYTTIENCQNNATVVGTYNVGGILGQADGSAQDMLIIACENSGKVTGVSYVGGIAGSAGYASIEDCINNGEVQATGYSVGGIVGGVRVSVKNCINTATVTGSNSVGGIAGDSYLAEISNCVSVSTIKDGIGGIIGTDSSSGGSILTNCYALELGNDYGQTCTIEQLNTQIFYTEILGWSEDIWDFTELDVNNGKYPKLK